MLSGREAATKKGAPAPDSSHSHLQHAHHLRLDQIVVRNDCWTICKSCWPSLLGHIDRSVNDHSQDGLDMVTCAVLTVCYEYRTKGDPAGCKMSVHALGERASVQL